MPVGASEYFQILSSRIIELGIQEAIIWTMTGDKVKRRLATVLCADVHGYSRLMEADEAGTLGTLRRYRTAIAGLVERHDGRCRPTS
jgi:adenylate cyclase